MFGYAPLRAVQGLCSPFFPGETMRTRTPRFVLPLPPLLALLPLLLGCATMQTPAGEAAGPPRVAQADAWQLPPLPPAAPISAAELEARRRALLDGVADGVLVVFGSPAPAFDYLPYEQDLDFRYLTGIVEPGAAYVAVRQGGAVRELLFVQPRDPAREVWEGARLGPEGARALTGLPARTNTEFPAVLDSLAAAHGMLFTTTTVPRDVRLVTDLSWAQQVLGRLVQQQPGLEVRNVQSRVRELRATKSPAELDRIRRAVLITTLAHREAMRATAAGMNEFEIRALLEYIFLRNGAEGAAYASIVGSGPNSTTLHYRAADRFMQPGEVLLIDAGASYGGYAADVTRTVPVDGRFSAEQRAIHEVVLAAHKAAESQIRLGATWAMLHEAANRELQQGLARLGLIDAPDAVYDCTVGQVVGECLQHRMFFMHGLGHGVGLAVHDPDVSQLEGGFRPGSAVTVEPGIYVRADVFDYLPDTPRNRAMVARLRPVVQQYVNIGVRIEDLYIFDERGVERVSSGVPREVDEIEALMREPSFAEAGRRAEIVEWYRLNRGR
jgi:Xaa-Pro aminopeptidase